MKGRRLGGLRVGLTSGNVFSLFHASQQRLDWTAKIVLTGKALVVYEMRRHVCTRKAISYKPSLVSLEKSTRLSHRTISYNNT